MDCIRWHESKQINVEIKSEMFCAGHSDGHMDACLGELWQKVLHTFRRQRKMTENIACLWP